MTGKKNRPQPPGHARCRDAAAGAQPVRERRPPPAPLLLLLPLCGVLAAFALFLSQTQRINALNLWPRFDAPQYALTAVNLLRYGEPAILIGNLFYPARYPFGFSAWLIPQLYFGNYDLPHLYWTTVACSALTLIVFYGLVYDLTRSRFTAALAALFLGTLPFYLRYSVLVMSDVPALLPLLGLHWIYLRILRRQFDPAHPAAARGDYGLWLLLGLLAGYLGSWRYSYALPLAVFAAHYHLYAPHARPVRRRTLLCALCGGALPLMALLLFNALYYGDPLFSGYQLWDYAFREEGRFAFSAQYILGRVHDDRDFGNLPNYLLRLLGAGGWEALYGFPLALAALYGCFRLSCEQLGRERPIALPAAQPALSLIESDPGEAQSGRAVPRAATRTLALPRHLYRCWLAGAGLMVVFFLCYVYQQDRFINFLLPLVCLSAAAGLAPIAAEKMPSTAMRELTNGLFVFFALIIVLVHLALIRGPRYAERTKFTPLYSEAQKIAPALPDGAVVFTNAQPALLQCALGGKQLVLPFLQEHFDRGKLLQDLAGRFPYEIAEVLVWELTDYHVLVIDQLETRPLKTWRPEFPFDYLPFLFVRGARLNQYLLDRLRPLNRPLYVILLLPDSYFSQPEFAEFTRRLVKVAGAESGVIAVYQLLEAQPAAPPINR